LDYNNIIGVAISAMSDDYRNTNQVLSIISEVNEVLALSNQPQNLLDMVLDALLELLKIDCCWVQLYQAESHSLQLGACRGFTQDMKQEIDSMDFEHSLAHQVAALGYQVSISDLSRNGKYGLSSFSEAGLRSVVAVPLMTYRIQGVMGIASLSKKRFSTGAGKLLITIAGLVSTALSKAYLYQRELSGEKKSSTSAPLEAQPVPNSGEIIETDSDTEPMATSTDKVTQQPEGTSNVIQGSSQEASKKTHDTFDEHTDRMKNFRQVHMEDFS
jgi:transcriptional regulator with GAF, ATPase, and Fis domain